MLKITNAQMLIAAKKQLRDHQATRPATRPEAEYIRQRYLTSGSKPTGSESSYDKAVSRWYVADCRLRAGAWQCDGEDMSEAWYKTEAAYQARVEHYAAKV